MMNLIYNLEQFWKKVVAGYSYISDNIEIFFREIWSTLVGMKRKAVIFWKHPREILATKQMESLVERTRELAFENANFAIFIAHILGKAWVEIDGTRVYGYSRVLYVDSIVGQLSFPIYFEFWNQLQTFPTYDTRKNLPEGEERVYEFRESKWDTHSSQDSLFRLAQLYDMIDAGQLTDVIRITKPEVLKTNPKKNPHARRQRK